MNTSTKLGRGGVILEIKDTGKPGISPKTTPIPEGFLHREESKSDVLWHHGHDGLMLEGGCCDDEVVVAWVRPNIFTPSI